MRVHDLAPSAILDEFLWQLGDHLPGLFVCEPSQEFPRVLAGGRREKFWCRMQRHTWCLALVTVRMLAGRALLKQARDTCMSATGYCWLYRSCSHMRLSVRMYFWHFFPSSVTVSRFAGRHMALSDRIKYPAMCWCLTVLMMRRGNRVPARWTLSGMC